MLKLATTLALVVLGFPAWACDEPRAAVRGYGYSCGAPAVRGAATYGYAPAIAYSDDDYDDDYYGYGYGYGGVGLAVGAGIARRAYWRNRFDDRVNWRGGGRGFVAARSVGVGRVGGFGGGRMGGGGRIGGRR